MLIGINEAHAFDDPEHGAVKHLSELAQTAHVLRLIEALESPRCLACHLGRRNVEGRESNLFDLAMNTIDRRTPGHHSSSSKVAMLGAGYCFLGVCALVAWCNLG